MKKSLCIILIVLFVPFLTGITFAAPPPTIPEPLKPWTDWVLHGHEEAVYCTPTFNNEDTLRCAWPSTLELIVDDRKGSFVQEWLVQNERYIPLPGDNKNWPENVEIDGNPTVVLSRNGGPGVKVPRGRHEISGQFLWSVIPEFVKVPGHTGIVSMTHKGRNVDFPNLDDSGRLWLQTRKQKEEKIENRLKLLSFRRIDDLIPARVAVLLKLDVAGAAREIILGPVFDRDRFVPVSLKSAIPARLEPDGKLRIQVRPGQWQITIVSRHIQPMASLTFNRPDDGFWPEEEIWVFAAQPNLRIVDIGGVPAIDPLQTSLPKDWRSAPAYRVRAGDTMGLKEVKRGDPRPAPDQLKLQRTLWLRFDGSGYTVQDRVTGKKTTNWRLEMNPPMELGSVSIDGAPQFVTRRESSEKAGVELRKGQLNLVADSLYRGDISRISATGWNHDFQQASARLHLPPGWRILHAAGIDNIPMTWIQRWTLLDLFIVLIFTIAVARLYSKSMAAVAFMTLTLIYHEPQAPRWIWLALIVGFALLRYLPEGAFKRVVKFYQVAAILALLAISLPFAISQLRVGIYPQLEKPWQSMINLSRRQAAPPAAMEAEDAAPGELSTMAPQTQVRVKKPVKAAPSGSAGQYRGKGYYARTQVAQYDPTMIQQTGPGMPVWQWNTVAMSWSGPVKQDQQISLVLIGPKTNLLLSVVRVILLVLLALGIMGVRYGRKGGIQYSGMGTFFLVLLVAVCLLAPSRSRAGDIPSPEMLNELRERLLEKEDCFPGCADFSLMDIRITPDHLQIALQADSQTDVAVPLPGSGKQWLPQQVLIDGQPAQGLFRDSQGLWALMPAGKHQLLIRGRLPGQNTVQLSMPLKPHRVNVAATGWTVEGVHNDGVPDNQIQFKRILEKQDLDELALTPGILPPFVTIERTLLLGLVWKVETKISRRSPAGSAIVMDVPLLAGESVITDGVRVQNGRVQINMGPQQDQLVWESFLEQTEQLHLKHGETDAWTEIWRVDVSPIFHMQAQGIPVIFHQQGNRWYPTWHPWPGEAVTLDISKPAGVDGQTLTIDKSHTVVRPGKRATDTLMTFSLRSSQGGRHTIVLPEGAQLQNVNINGKDQSIRQEGRNVPLPIIPGTQRIALKWRDSRGMTAMYRTPGIDLGLESVNANIDVHLPPNRWPLFVGGPRMGPAVLFWSVLIIIVLGAFGLSRTGWTPLRFHQWLLLGIGMSQCHMVAGFLVVGWLVAIDFRKKVTLQTEKRLLNLIQVGIGFLTILAVASLVVAISLGLLGHPDMNISGNGSTSGILRWYQDHSGHLLPQSWVISIPMLVYRLAMLAWSLWISFALIDIIKTGWQNFTEPVIWYRLKWRKDTKRKDPDTAGPGSDAADDR